LIFILSATVMVVGMHNDAQRMAEFSRQRQQAEDELINGSPFTESHDPAIIITHPAKAFFIDSSAGRVGLNMPSNR
jgi:hypothetical protein